MTTYQQQRQVTLDRVRERRERAAVRHELAVMRVWRDNMAADISRNLRAYREPIVTLEVPPKPEPQPRKWWEIWK